MSEDMNMQENARLVLGLRSAGWSEKKINDFLLYIETGDEQYKPTPDKEQKKGLEKIQPDTQKTYQVYVSI